MYLDDKINPTLDGILKEKRLSISVTGKEHTLLEVPSLGKKLGKFTAKEFVRKR